MSTMIACVTCGAQMANTAVSCPNCGASNNLKNAVIALVLAFFLGAVGGHNWYLGRYLRAFLQLCFGAFNLVVGWIPIIGWAFVGILTLWIILEGIAILLGSAKDGDGRPVVF